MMTHPKRAAFFLTAVMASTYGFACSTADFQSCKKCSQLDAAIDLKNPQAGDYYRGVQWNGLYSAYVLNCPVTGAKLIKVGANPASGGSNGSMILTVSQKWPHNNKKINDSWAAILLSGKASIDKRIKEMDGKNTKEIVAELGSFKPDYIDLYAIFEN